MRERAIQGLGVWRKTTLKTRTETLGSVECRIRHVTATASSLWHLLDANTLMVRFLVVKAVVKDIHAQVLHSLRLWVLAPTVASVDAEHGEQELPFHSRSGHNAILDLESHSFSNETVDLVFANGVAHDVRTLRAHAAGH